MQRLVGLRRAVREDALVPQQRRVHQTPLRRTPASIPHMPSPSQSPQVTDPKDHTRSSFRAEPTGKPQSTADACRLHQNSQAARSGRSVFTSRKSTSRCRKQPRHNDNDKMGNSLGYLGGTGNKVSERGLGDSVRLGHISAASLHRWEARLGINTSYHSHINHRQRAHKQSQWQKSLSSS